MNREHRIIELYLSIEAACTSIFGKLGRSKLRQCGKKPNLTDAEFLTIEIFGEICGHHTDAAIWRYINAHWLSWFPKLNSYTAFAKQSANLFSLKQLVMAHMYPPKDTIHITDGVPMPVCHYVRASRCRSYQGEASFGFCAAKDEKYYGFKGHVLIDLQQRVVGFTLAPANIDERDVLQNYCGEISGLVIADRGLISKDLQENLLKTGIDLQTPLRDNMADDRPEKLVRLMMTIRRRVETNYQLVLV